MWAPFTCRLPRHPQGQDADVEALPEYEEWVLKEWEQFKDVAED
jgi:hypothetical protein